MLDPPRRFASFLTRRGGDIRLKLLDDAVPVPSPDEALFVSGGLWTVSRHDGGVLYAFRSRRVSPHAYKGVWVDHGLTRGTLFFPPTRGGPRYALDYPLDELLFQHRLTREGGLEIHACGVVLGGRLALLCGRSGAGKSTLARLFRRHRPEALLLSDDRIVLRRSRRGLIAYGTPWHGDGGFADPGHAPLGGVFFLRQARANALRPLRPGEAAARLLARSFPPPWDGEALARALELTAVAAQAVPCYELRFARDRGAVETIAAALGNPSSDARRSRRRRAAL